MQFNVNRGNVEWVVRKQAEALRGSEQFSLGEVLLGLTEILGRTIVGTTDTPIQAMTMIDAIQDHLRTTIKAGYVAKGFNMGEH